MRLLLVVIAILVIAALVMHDGPAERRNAAATAPWQSTVSVDISRALAKNAATGCGEYRFKSVDGDSEYLVECYDGNQKRFYQVWPNIDAVTGPFTSDPY